MISYKEIECLSLLNHMPESLFTIRSYSIRLSANPYSGCVHRCAWCYASYIHKFNTRHDSTVTPEDFGSKIFVKINAPQVLEKELQAHRRKKLPLEWCDMSTITDAYQPIERKYRLTRQCLEHFLTYKFPVTLLTRSHLVLDDIDLWAELARNKIGVVGISITRPTTINPQIKAFLEPGSPNTDMLLDALMKLTQRGIPTFVFVNPLVPLLIDSDATIDQLFKEIASTGCKTVFCGVLKFNPLSWGLFKKPLEGYDASLVAQFKNIYFDNGNKEFGRVWQPSYSYRHNLYAKASNICATYGLGFSCEGGLYHLWLNDWADVENPYRYPTGYNLWKIIKDNRGLPTSFEYVAQELTTYFSIHSKHYWETLRILWNEKKLFGDLPDIELLQEAGDVLYRYKSMLPD